MKKLALLVLAIASLSAFAGTCVIKNYKLTEINGDQTASGEIRNETDIDFLAHKVLVAFLDSDNNVLQTKSVEGCLRSLQSGTSDFFAAPSTEDPNDVAKTLQRIDFAGLKVGQTVNGELNYSNIEVTRNGDTLVVTGTIKNDDSDDLEDVRVCVVVRDVDDKILTVKRDNDTYDLNSGDDADFSITIDVVDDNDDVDSVDLWADATNKDEGDDVTEPQSTLGKTVDECSSTSTPTHTPTGVLPTATPVTPTAIPTGTATATPVDTAC